MPSFLLLDIFDDSCKRPRLSVGSCRQQHVENVAQGGNPPRERDGRARNTERITGSIEFLVVGQGDLGAELQELRRAVAQNIVTGNRMMPDDLKFSRRPSL